MKFKLIFVLFNGIIVTSFLFIFLMPLFVLGFDYTASFWGQNWYLIIVFLVILAALDVYFVVNWKLFMLLEKEDWTGLSELLEERVLINKKFGEQDIRLLCNAYVVQGKPLQIGVIEESIRASNPKLLFRYGLLLGIPHLLRNEPEKIIAFFEPLVRDEKTADGEWIRFNYAFGLLAEKRVTEAASVLDGLAVQKKERLVQLLSLYLLDSSQASEVPGAEARNNRLSAARVEFRSNFSAATFEKFVRKQRENLQVIILNKFIGEAAQWIFAPAQSSAPVATGAGADQE